MIAVDYIDHMGTDLTVVNAARVSHSKLSQWENDTVGRLSDRDKKLIAYLAQHDHWTPFSHPQISLRVTVPVVIRAQLDKSRVGLTINEISRRYVDDPPEFFFPTFWRSRPTGSIKQGSGAIIEGPSEDEIDRAYASALQCCGAAYDTMIKAGVAPEQARFVLPQCMMTSFVWTGSLAAFARVYMLRTAPESQQEIRTAASMIGSIINPLFPYSWAALTEKARG